MDRTCFHHPHLYRNIGIELPLPYYCTGSFCPHWAGLTTPVLYNGSIDLVAHLDAVWSIYLMGGISRQIFWFFFFILFANFQVKKRKKPAHVKQNSSHLKPIFKGTTHAARSPLDLTLGKKRLISLLFSSFSVFFFQFCWLKLALLSKSFSVVLWKRKQ